MSEKKDMAKGRAKEESTNSGEYVCMRLWTAYAELNPMDQRVVNKDSPMYVYDTIKTL